MSGRDESRLYCPQCGVFHGAVRIECDNQIFWRVNCPRGNRDVRISSDARLIACFVRRSVPCRLGTDGGYQIVSSISTTIVRSIARFVLKMRHGRAGECRWKMSEWRVGEFGRAVRSTSC